MKAIAATAAVLAFTGAAAAETVRVPSAHSVEETVTRLTEAAEEAGANVFARVPHSAGAESIGEDLAPMTLVIFGNPAVGTPALQADPLAGLALPLRILVYEDDASAVWLAYEDPAEMLTHYDIPEDHPVIARIEGALSGLTGTAAGNE